METGEEILKGLEQPGMRLVFADESGTHGHPLPNLAADFQIVCGVQLDSGVYAQVKKRLETRRRELDVDEFHATEMVRPSGGSSWSRVPRRDRFAVMRELTALVANHVERIFYAYVAGEQYRVLLSEGINSVLPEQRGVSRLTPTLSQGDALQGVFILGLIRALSASADPRQPAIVCDSRRYLGDALEVVTYSPNVLAPLHAYQDGVIYAASDDVVGLQLVDHVAFTLNRVFRAKHNHAIGREGKPLDREVLESYEAFRPRMHDLLQPGPVGV